MAPPKKLGKCEVVSCADPAVGRGYCNRHYQLWRRHGRPECPAPELFLRKRFEAKIAYEPNSGCWLWTGSSAPFGHGIISVNRKHKFAHRISWEMHVGPIRNGLCVLHKCDVPACVNPEHLFLGTTEDNFTDMRTKRRHAFGARSGTAQLTDADVKSIRLDTRPYQEIAHDYEVTTATVRGIKRRRSWRHVNGMVLRSERKHKITETQAREIKAATGTQRVIAAQFGVSQTLVSKIKAGKVWA